MHEVLVNDLGGLSLPRKSVVRLTDHPDMTLDTVDVKQQYNNNNNCLSGLFNPIAPRMAKTLWNFGHSECNRVKAILRALSAWGCELSLMYEEPCYSLYTALYTSCSEG